MDSTFKHFNLIDYDNCITNLACSVQKEFGLTPKHGTLKYADDILRDGYTNVVVMLLDGFGANIVANITNKNSFFKTNLKKIYKSTYPPTTVAATRSIETGLYPIESGWMGWTEYFKDIDKNVILFWNMDADKENTDAADFNVANRFIPYKSIVTQITEAGYAAYNDSPFEEPNPKDFDEQCEMLLRLCSTNEKKYVYFYTPEPDSTMHETGINSEKTIRCIDNLEKKIEKLCDELSKLSQKTVLFITADHGHINVKNDNFENYPDVIDCFLRMPSLESRTINMFIKPECINIFPDLFNSHFKDKYILLSKEEVMQKEIFGKGVPSSVVNDILGDYIAFAITPETLFPSPEISNFFKGHHAGLTKEEMEIPLIVIEIK